MKKLELCLDIWAGPIWHMVYDAETGEIIGETIKVVEEDEKVQKLNKKIQEMFSELYDLSGENHPNYFDFEGLERLKPEFRKLMQALKDRLNEINDGSFIVEDNVRYFD